MSCSNRTAIVGHVIEMNRQFRAFHVFDLIMIRRCVVDRTGHPWKRWDGGDAQSAHQFRRIKSWISQSELIFQSVLLFMRRNTCLSSNQFIWINIQRQFLYFPRKIDTVHLNRVLRDVFIQIQKDDDYVSSRFHRKIIRFIQFPSVNLLIDIEFSFYCVNFCFRWQCLRILIIPRQCRRWWTKLTWIKSENGLKILLTVVTKPFYRMSNGSCTISKRFDRVCDWEWIRASYWRQEWSYLWVYFNLLEASILVPNVLIKFYNFIARNRWNVKKCWISTNYSRSRYSKWNRSWEYEWFGQYFE